MSKSIIKPDTLLPRLARFALIIYPLIAHIAIMLDQAVWAAGYLLIVVYFNSLTFFFKHRFMGKSLALILFAVLSYSFLFMEVGRWVIYLPPILIPAWLAFVFIGSMSKERAFISLIAEKIEGKPLNKQHLRYTRRLTVLWGVVFILMISEAIVLGIWAPFELWSWWVHIGNYLILAVLFALEFLLRPLFIKQQTSIANMIKELLQQNWYESKDK